MRLLRFQSGVTYLAALLFIAIVGGALAAVGTIWRTAQQREKEAELLFIGDQFRKAIMLYYEKTPGTVKRYPATLNDLLQDDRSVSTQRYLRKIYVDPMMRKKEWGIVMAPDGGIMGIHSLSEDEPIKKSNFSPAYQDFEGKAKYTEWQFVYQPNLPPVSQQTTSAKPK